MFCKPFCLVLLIKQRSNHQVIPKIKWLCCGEENKTSSNFGKALGSGAYLKALRRTAIGTYQVSDAWQLDDLVDYIKHDELTKSGADVLNVEDQSNSDR